MPIEPPPSAWALPDPGSADEYGIIGVGADLAPGTLLAAYRSGIFPMPIEGELAWWSPDPRAVLPLAGLRVSRSLRRSVKRFDVSFNSSFDDVVAGCADPSRTGGVWITPEIRSAYGHLHELGWAHSVEVWREGTLVGGLYGVAIGGLFAGESMFHTESDASKVALVALVEQLNPAGLLDVQWQTNHLASLGAIEIPRAVYLQRLSEALLLRLPLAFRRG
ncbi:MAG: leucyl/phenylalanyl-tRNA--protein transferase [Acidimicrobiia bacterium]|nr:leucyl/phenylalanyl-tRNA--protein transferase [Acidimicrobiia bacterium]